MSYIVGDCRISLEEDLDPESQLILASHPEIFKYCLNGACYKLLQDLNKIVQLYGDVLTIYSTLLKKITNYDDVTAYTAYTQARILGLEDMFQTFFSIPLNEEQNWQFHNYEQQTRVSCLLWVQSVKDVFSQVISCLNCIQLFFESYDNLRKLLILHSLPQTMYIHESMARLVDLFHLTTIVDDYNTIRAVLPINTKQLRFIEILTTRIERESSILNSTFNTFDTSLQTYIAVLAKAFMKIDISTSSCQVVKRREVCLHAAEHIVNIPLCQEQKNRLSLFELGFSPSWYLIMVWILLMAAFAILGYRMVMIMFWD